MRFNHDATRPSANLGLTRHGAPSASLPIVLVALLAVAIAAPVWAATWNVAGVVRFSDGTPAAGATVRLWTAGGVQSSTTADGNGNYAVSLDQQGGDSVFIRATWGSLSSPTQQVMDHDITENLVLGGTPGGN